jgi:medium-chain acyl-[acyl-carrier-protein] hydrolase
MTDPSWFVCPRPNPDGRLRLFCFPYAGGGIPVFRGWWQGLPDIEVWGASLPGRGARLREQPLTSLPQLVEQLGTALQPFTGEPFAFFGHSLGARIAFELARWLRRQERPLPNHLLLSACPAPHCPRTQPVLHTLPREQFITAMRQRHTLPDEILAHPEMLDLVLPALEADVTVWETAVYTAEPALPCPITTFGGTADPLVGDAQLAAWSPYTTAAFAQIPIPGDHLFLNTHRNELLEAVGRRLTTADR